MSAARVLVAGVGNVFFKDDAFGVEVAERLAREPFPADVRVADFGIRGVHLAYEIAGGAYDVVVFVDAVDRRAAPGELFVIEPERDVAGSPVADAHSMELENVFAHVARLGGTTARFLLVGCQPADAGDGMGLSPAVAAAVPAAVRLVTELVRKHRSEVTV